MIQVDITGPENKKENSYIRWFSHFIGAGNGMNDGTIIVTALDTGQGQLAPDYCVETLKILVEVKEAHDREHVEWSASLWGSIARLEKAISLLNAQTLGTFIVTTPGVLQIPVGQEHAAAAQIVQAVMRGNTEVRIDGLGRFEIERMSPDGTGIHFGSDVWTRWVPPWGTRRGEAERILRKANRQLASTGQDEFQKILLFVQRETVYDDDFYKSLASHFDLLADLESIDQIWLQRSSEGEETPTHELLYSRSFLLALREGRPLEDKTSRDLLAKWFESLVREGDPWREWLFNALKGLPGDRRPHELFITTHVRESMVRLGEWLGETKRFSELEWLVERFLSDPDPLSPEAEGFSNSTGEHYHREVATGNNPRIITTVLGHTAWATRWLALDPARIVRSLDFTTTLLNNANWYVRYQATFPLAEIASRRQSLIGFGTSPRQGDLARFHDLAFTQLAFLREHHGCVSFAARMCRVFNYYEELTEKESLEVIGALSITADSAALLINYALFREQRSEKTGILFDGTSLREQLKNVLKKDENVWAPLRATILWNFWQLVSKDKSMTDIVSPYVDILLKSPITSSEVCNYTAHLAEETLKKELPIGGAWYARLIHVIAQAPPGSPLREALIKNWALWNAESIMLLVARRAPRFWIDAARGLCVDLGKNLHPSVRKSLLETHRAMSDGDAVREAGKLIAELEQGIGTP
jgi:hypothetical protein